MDIKDNINLLRWGDIVFDFLGLWREVMRDWLELDESLITSSTANLLEEVYYVIIRRSLSFNNIYKTKD